MENECIHCGCELDGDELLAVRGNLECFECCENDEPKEISQFFDTEDDITQYIEKYNFA